MATMPLSVVNPFGGAGRWTPDHRFVLSVYPGALKAERIYRGKFVYRLPAAPRGGFSVLKVYDIISSRPVWNQDGEREDQPTPMTAKSIADCIVNEWVRGRVGLENGIPGVGVLVVPPGEPYPAEIDTSKPIDQQPEAVRTLLNSLRESQTGYFRGLYREGQRLAMAHKFGDIRDDHRLSVQWLGLKVDWDKQEKQVPEKACPICAADIPALVLVCPNCKTDLPEYYLKYGVEPQEDAAVAAFIAKIPEARRRQIAGEPEPPKAESKPVVTPQFPNKK
jgi:hypothetical protein